MAMRAMTREIAQCDSHLRGLVCAKRVLIEEGTDPDELASLAGDIDDWLDRRNALSEGRARGGRRTG